MKPNTMMRSRMTKSFSRRPLDGVRLQHPDHRGLLWCPRFESLPVFEWVVTLPSHAMRSDSHLAVVVPTLRRTPISLEGRVRYAVKSCPLKTRKSLQKRGDV